MVGYRFRPKIEFLIKLLQFKAAGGGDISGCTVVPGDVRELYMYGSGKEPWRIFSGEDEIREFHDVNRRTIKEKYVVTKLSKLKRKNVTRTAGNGSWDDQSTQKPVMIGGREMGHWRTLTYEYWGGDGAEEGKCYYYMNELHLSEYALGQCPTRSDDYYVLCRVLKNEEKTCRNRQGVKKRPVCTDNNLTGQDYPLLKKNRGSSSSSPTVTVSGLNQSVPVYDLNLNQEQDDSLGFYSALLQGNDAELSEKSGKNWKPYMASPAFMNLIELD